MFCTECGAEINPRARFCGKCGSPVMDSLEEENGDAIQNSRPAKSESPSDWNNEKYDSGVERSRRSDQRFTPEISANDSGLIKAFKRRQKDS